MGLLPDETGVGTDVKDWEYHIVSDAKVFIEASECIESP